MRQDAGGAEFEHAMLREIYEQPHALTETIEHYRFSPPGAAEEIFRPLEAILRGRDRLLIAASGSSRNAGLVGEIMFEDLAGLPVDVEYASEYAFRPAQMAENAAVLGISQSGETADTLAALRRTQSRGIPVLAITNHPRSAMAAVADASFPTCAGPENAIPATKSFTTQLAVLYAMALFTARLRGRMTPDETRRRFEALRRLPDDLAPAIDPWRVQIARLAPRLSPSRGFLLLGRGAHYPIAREGALKLKESACLQADGYPAGELKHGPNALVGVDAPLIVIATRDRADANSMLRYEKIVRLMEEMRAQGALIVTLATEGDDEAARLSDECIYVPQAEDLLSAILEVVPLQLLAYQMALEMGLNMDKPRNLAKAVLRE